MCIIAICPDRALTKQEFDNCWDSNRDGFGYAFWTGTTVVSRKGFMNKSEAWDEYQKIPVPHVAHFRIASAGGVCPELTHPFQITDKSAITYEHRGTASVLFHNGTVQDYRSLLMNAIFQTRCVPRGPMSDSRAMAICLSVVGEDLLEMYPYQKWVVVRKDGFTKYGEWVESEGVLFSNSGFRPTVATTYQGSYTGYNLWPGQEEEREEETPWRERAETVARFQQQREFPNITALAYKRDKFCSNCLHVYKDTESQPACTIKGSLRDNVACNLWRSKKDKGVSDDPCRAGAGVITVNGKPLVEENYLERLDKITKRKLKKHK